ncbi:MAG: ABC transporter substrate-binding protein [Verrucomicrobia bacterium]|nr:ABC transporter substrate-binding protein [Verrucomicrobiota bacterium]
MIAFWLMAALSVFGVRAVAGPVVVRVGHFPNVTHAQGVVGHAWTREGKGWFEERLGAGTEVRWFVYTSGSSAMEAVFAGSIDLVYVGPNPAINAHLRSRGEEVRIVSGACSGGAALVVQGGEGVRSDADFRGKRMGTPQFGNTQDVAARAWLGSKGFRITVTGGDVLVVPTSTADQFALFKKGDLDAVWGVEPQISRLVLHAGARIYLEERDLWPETGGRYVTAELVSSMRFIRESPELLERWLLGHVELTRWINGNTGEAKRVFTEEMRAETGRGFPVELLDAAWGRLEFTHDPLRRAVERVAEDAHRVGFLRTEPDLKRLFELEPLNRVLRRLEIKEVEQ